MDSKQLYGLKKYNTKQKLENRVILFYIMFYSFATIILGLLTIKSHNLYGEAVGLVNLKLDNADLAFILMLYITPLFMSFPLYKLITNKHFKTCRTWKLHFTYNEKNLGVALCIITVVQIWYTIKTGHGRLLSDISLSGGSSNALLNMLNISAFFPIYYLMCKRRGVIYWTNVVLFAFYRIICGWSGFVLEFAFYELYIQVTKKKIGRSLAQWLKFNIPVTVSAYMIGGYLYKFLYPIKEYVRHGYFSYIDFSEGLSRLVTRLSGFPVALVGVQNHRQIAGLFQKECRVYDEVLSVFRSLLPRSIMPYKEFRTLNNIVIQSMYNDLPNTTGSNYGVLIYLWNLIESNISSFLIYIFVFGLLYIINLCIIRAFETYRGELNFIIFIQIFCIMDGVSIESMFGYGIFGELYFIAIMVFLGIIQIDGLRYPFAFKYRFRY